MHLASATAFSGRIPIAVRSWKHPCFAPYPLLHNIRKITFQLLSYYVASAPQKFDATLVPPRNCLKRASGPLSPASTPLHSMPRCYYCKSAVLLRMNELPPVPWHTLHLDHFGPFSTGDYILVVKNAYNRYLEMAIVK